MIRSKKSIRFPLQESEGGERYIEFMVLLPGQPQDLPTEFGRMHFYSRGTLL